MKIVIVSGGKVPSYELLRKEISNCELLIAADKGAEVLLNYNINPNLVVGDFDSIDKKILQKFDENLYKIEKFPPEKDYTDTFIAVNRAIKLGADEIVLLGCTGSRLDHVIGNVGILYKCLKKGIKCIIKDDNNIISLVDKSTCIESQNLKYFSLLSYGEEVKKLTIKGGKYTLNDYTLKIGEGIGISNEFKEKQVKIIFSEGILLIIQSKD